MSVIALTLSPSSSKRFHGWQWLVIISVIAFFYATTGMLGMRYATLPPFNVTAVWPPSGIAIAAVLIFGWRALVGIFVGAFISNYDTLLIAEVFPRGVFADLGIASGAVIQSFISAWLLRRFTEGEQFYNSTRGVLLFTLLSGLLAPTINATIGSSSLVLMGFAEPAIHPNLWFTWWMGDVGGVMIVAPVLLVWWQPRRAYSRDQWLKLFALLGILAVLSIIVTRSGQPVIYLVLPVISLIAFAYEASGASLAIFITNGIAIASATQGMGRFVQADINETMILLQAFTVTVSLSALLLAAAMHERRCAAAAIEEARRTLEDKVAQRTSELSEAKDAAEAAARSKSLYVAHTAHEFRTPLGAIIGYTEALAEGYLGDADVLDQDQRDALSAIEKNARRLIALINDTLEISKIESGSVTLNLGTLSPRALVDETIAELASLARQNGLYLRAEFADDAPETIVCDGARLQQVLINLIGNALKFTNSGGVTVTVSPAEQPDQWQVVVRDTGVGIEPGDFQRIFETFQRGESRHQPVREGTGLGLPIARQLARLMGGDITLSSTPGEGSIFTVTLPRTVSPSPTTR